MKANANHQSHVCSVGIINLVLGQVSQQLIENKIENYTKE